MLKNMKIKTLLILAFAIICLSASTITFTSFFGFQFVTKDFGVLKDNTWPKTILANQIYKNINEIARAIRNVALLDDKESIAKETSRINKAMTSIDGIIDKFNNMPLDAKEKQLITAIVDAKNRYKTIQEEALKITNEGKKKEVITFLIEKVRPIQAAYFNTVDEFLQYQNSGMEKSADTVGKTVKTIQGLTVLFAAIGTVIAVLIAFFTIIYY